MELDCVNLPAGVTCAYDPATPTPPGDGSVTRTLTLAAGATVPFGMKTITVRSTSNGAARNPQNLALHVTQSVTARSPSAGSRTPRNDRDLPQARDPD